MRQEAPVPHQSKAASGSSFEVDVPLRSPQLGTVDIAAHRTRGHYRAAADRIADREPPTYDDLKSATAGCFGEANAGTRMRWLAHFAQGGADRVRCLR